MRRLVVGMITTAAALMAAGGPAQARELFFYNWSNYYPPELLQRFERETGIRVTLDVYDSNETLLAKLQAGAAGYDVVVPSDYILPVMINEGLLEPLDAPSLTNFKNIKKPFDDVPFDQGRRYSVPYMYGTTGFTYDSARVPGGTLEPSWKTFFEPPEELHGQIGAMNDEVEMWNAAAYYLGIDKCTEQQADGRAILELMEKQKPYVTTYNSDGILERVVAKEVILHQQWNGSAHRAKEKLSTAVYVYPQEGLTLWMDNLTIAKGAPHPQEAREFIDWMLEPENMAAASNFTGYNSAIEGTEQFLDASMRDDPAVVAPAEAEPLFRPSKDCSAASRELRNKVWTRLRS